MMGYQYLSKKIKNQTILFSCFALTFSLLSSCEKQEPETLIDYQTITLKQEFSSDWSRWIYNGDTINGSFKTEFSNSWDRWLYNGQNQSGQIRTEFSESWDRWNYYTDNGLISIRTEFNESWNRWKISGSSLTEDLFIRTQFSTDNTRWIISTAQSTNIAEMKTVFSNDYRRWELRYNPDQVQLEELEVIPLLFISVFTASIIEQEVF